MDAQQKYVGEVIQLFSNLASMSRPPRSTISDDQYENELSAAASFYNALNKFRGEVLAASKLTTFPKRRDALTDIIGYLDDLTPSMTAWEEEISNARRGYITAGIK